MKRIRENDIFKIVEKFRMAIVDAKHNDEFCYKDRMNNFPGGCCDDACDLLAYFLHFEYGISTCQGNGIYRDENPENTTNHAWLIVDNKIIVDITISQFKYCTGFDGDIYIGKETAFYKHLENRRRYENCDITRNRRLWDDYQIIMKYLK